MGKSKKNKKANADAVYAKKSNAQRKANPFAAGTATTTTLRKLNPFEVHVNNEKFQILGRTCNHDKGLPGVSRGKAIKKRKETLGQEFQDKHKNNLFRDRRIGRNLEEISDDVLNARFIAEKLSQMKDGKASRFNLNDDEVLTHRGQTLEEIEQFRDERSDDEELDDEDLAADFTEAAHFGGDAAALKDRNTAIEEMILEQKKRKVEIAKEKDEVHNLTEQLDSNYKQLISLVGKIDKKEERTKEAPDDYDKAMREMIFEPRGKVSDKLLSEEDLAKKEKERLEKLERARLKRMQGEEDESEQNAKPKHRSADDLDDGYFAAELEEEEGTLAYNLNGELEGTNAAERQDEADDEQQQEEENESESAEEDDDNEEEEEDSEAQSDEDEADNLSDLKDDTDSENDAEETAPKKRKKTPDNKQQVQSAEKLAVRTDLPYTVEMPNTYKEFAALLSKYTPEDQAVIVERIIKCNHPKLDGVNREKVVKLFAFLLQYINELFADAMLDNIAERFKLLHQLNPQLFDLLHLNPEKMSTTLLNVIKEKYAEYNKNAKNFPTLETLIFLKMVANYFSTSDFRHAVVTPCYIFVQHILAKARVRTRQDVAMGLFLVTIALEYAQQSKRFLPAAYNFLLGIVYLSIPKRAVEMLKCVPPFVSTGPMSKLLAIGEEEYKTVSATCSEQPLTSEDLVTSVLSTDFKIRALNLTLKLIKDAINLASENVGSNYLAEPLLAMLQRLPLEKYPTFLQQNYADAKAALESVATKTLIKIVPPARKPKALRLLEPRIERVYDDKRRPKLSKEKEERVKLVHKVKRETKGALREIRRDTAFIQDIRIQQQIQSDMERKEKVRRIYHEAAMQQGELNELSRLKKRKKF